MKFNNNLKWINYEEFNSYLIKIINKNEKDLNKNEVQNYINMPSDLDNSKKINDENKITFSIKRCSPVFVNGNNPVFNIIRHITAA